MTTSRWTRLIALAAVAAACTTDTSVGPRGVTALDVVPATGEVVLDRTFQLQAVARDSDGVAYVGLPVTWTSSDPNVATVSASGTVRGVSTGTATITATGSGFTATAAIAAVTPATITLSGTALSFTGTPNAPDPAPQTLNITNGGGAALTDLVAGTIVYAPGATGWLSAALDRATAPAALTVTADVAGLATGTYSATVPVTSATAANSPRTITVSFTVAVGPAQQMTAFAGGSQSAIAATAVAIDPAVVVLYAFNTPVPGVTVTFAVTTGGGNVTAASPLTDANGVATVGSWTLGTTAGANTLEATSPGLPTVVFNATGVPGNAAQIALAGGDLQTDTVGATLATAYRVRVTDNTGANGVANVTVAWAVPAGQGSITPSSLTDANGFASATRVLGTGAGPQTATAAVGGLLGSPVTFTATGNPGAAVTVALNSGANQFATAGTAVGVPPSVIVRDGFGNPRPGVAVTFAATTGDASVTAGAQITGANGIATIGSWNVSSVRRIDTLSATAPGLAGSPVIISARAAWGLAAHVQPQVFLTTCVSGCHNVTTGPPPRMGDPTVAYQSLLNGNGTMTRYVTPFDTTDDGGLRTFGTLLFRLKSTTNPMPFGTPLAVSNPTFYAMIRDWIVDGARP